MDIFLILLFWFLFITKTTFSIAFLNNYPQIDTIAYILYDYCPIALILGGLILFVALIGVIILTNLLRVIPYIMI